MGHTHEQFQDSNFASRFAKEMLGDRTKQAAWKSFKTTARLWAGAFTEQTSVAFVLGAIHSLIVGEFFIPSGCWTENFSTSILEAHSKRFISQGEKKELISLALLFNKFMRHIEHIESSPGLSRNDKQWRMTPEWEEYNKIARQISNKNQLQIAN